MQQLPILYCIPYNTQYLETAVTFQQDNLYTFVDSDGDIDEYVTTDSRGDEHYADREWLLENFEVYEEQLTIIEVTE